MDRPPLIFSSTVWNLLTRQKTFGAIPTCSLNNSMKRRELKPVLSTTSAILAVAGLARNFPTAYSTTGSHPTCPRLVQEARLPQRAVFPLRLAPLARVRAVRQRAGPTNHPIQRAGCAVRRWEISEGQRAGRTKR